jgi:hypothetical protein
MRLRSGNFHGFKYIQLNAYRHTFSSDITRYVPDTNDGTCGHMFLGKLKEHWITTRVK